MISCIIIDDKQDAIDIIVSHLTAKSDIKLVNTFTSSIQGLDFIIQNQIDLVFLDIDMPDLSGLELIEYLKAKTGFILPQFILATGHEEFALKSYDYGVIDYIIKPISFKRFNQAVDRYLESLVNKKLVLANQDTFFFAETEGKKIRVDYEDILYIEGSGNYISLFKKDKRLILLRTLNDMEQMLNPNNFMRVHKSFIVAINKIISFANNEIQVTYKNEIVNIPIGRTFKEVFKKRLGLE